MNNQFLAEEISKREYQVINRDKMIKYLQEEHKKRGEEILQLKDQLHRRNALVRKLREEIKDLEAKVEELREQQGKLKNLCIVVLNDLEHFDLSQVTRYTEDLKKVIHQ